ncbi:MAG: molybdopterin converting factor subunit 1 [Candidatus Saccharibacteria bacterium]|nr:molybdopterin converting factor subunit 1 [Moraxellaceae bacterium]
MTVKVLFFAKLREKMGIKEIEIELTQSVTLEEFEAILTAKYPIFADLPQPVLVSVNQAFAAHEQSVSVGDEVAFFPPVTGG